MKAIGTMMRLSIVLLAFMIAGCAAPLQVKERYFWPPAPDTPRVEWLGAYQNSINLKESSGVWNAIVGENEGYSLDVPLFVASNGAGKVYVSDLKVGTFLVFDFNAREVHALGKAKGANLFEHPSGVALDADGNIYAADLKQKKIFVFSSDETPKGVLDISDKVESIGAIAVDKVRKKIIVPDIKGHKIVAIDLTGALLWSVGKRGIGGDEFNYPTSAAVDKEGNIIVCDSMNARIVRLTPEGKPLSFFGERGDGPGSFAMIKAVAVDSSGHIYVTDGKSSRVAIFNEKGDVLLNVGYLHVKRDNLVAPGGFNMPQGIYIDDKDAIYVVDQHNARFQVFQYMSEQYLKEHPITADAPAAKPSKAPVDLPAGVGKK
ncbi:MAG: hypothetical protein WA003_17315 [Desulfuromonadaceae bacterium]